MYYDDDCGDRNDDDEDGEDFDEDNGDTPFLPQLL